MKQLLLLAGTVGLAFTMPAAPASAQDASPSSVAGSPSVLWSWKVQPAVGSRYVLRTFSRTEMQMGGLPSAPARAGRPKTPTSVSIISRSSSVADYEVLSRDAQNATTVKITYRTFDSSSSAITPGASTPLPTPAQNASSKMMQDFMVGVSLTMKIAPDGKVWSVLGLDKLRARMMRAFAGMPGGAAVVQSVGGFFSEDTYKNSLSQSTGELPPFAIAAGDSWPYKISLPLPMGMDSSTQGTRTLLARRDGVATIKESGTFNLTKNPDAPAPGGASTSAAMPRMTMRMRGSTNGSTRVDEASGLPLEANATMTMSGRMSIEAPAAPTASNPKPGAAAQTVSMTMTARATTRTVMEPVATAGA